MNLWFGLLPLLALFAFCCKCQNVVISQTTVSALTGDSLTLTCTPPNNEEAHVFTWKKDRVVISESDSKFVLLSFDASMHSTLVFNPAVQSLSGIYTCVLDGDPSNSASANVTIDPGCLPAPFRGNTAVGESVEYRCADVYSEFNPNGIMSWQCTTDQSWDVNMEACMFSSENSSSLHLLAYCLEASDEQVSENSTSIGNELVTSLNIYVNWQVAYIGRGPKYGQTLLVLALGISESNVHSQLDNLRILVQAGGFTLGGYQAEPYERDSAVWNGYVLFQSASSCNCPVRWSTAVATWTQSTVGAAVQLCFGPSYITAPCICQDQNSNCQCSASFEQRYQSVCFLDTDGDGITELSDECQDCCPSEIKGGIEWPVTPQGMYYEETCQNLIQRGFHLIGYIRRSCGTNGVWGEVDYSKCYSYEHNIFIVIIAEVSSTSNINSAELGNQFEDFFQGYPTNGTLELNVIVERVLQNNEVVLLLGYWSDDQDTSILSVFRIYYGPPPGAYTFAADPFVLGFTNHNESVSQCDTQDIALQTTRFIAGNPNSCTCPLHLQQCQCLPEYDIEIDSSTNTTFCERKISSSTVIDSCSVKDGGNRTCPAKNYYSSFWDRSYSEYLIETPACNVLQQRCQYGGYLRVACGGDGVWAEVDLSNCHSVWLSQCQIKTSDLSYAISQALPVRQGARIDLSSETYMVYGDALVNNYFSCYFSLQSLVYPSDLTTVVEGMADILHVAQHTNYFVSTGRGSGASGVEKRINWLFTMNLRSTIGKQNYNLNFLEQWKELAKYNPLSPLVYFNTFEQLCVEITRVLPLDPSATTSAAVPGQGSVSISAWYYDTTNSVGYLSSSGIDSTPTITFDQFIGYPFNGYSKLPHVDDRAIQLKLDVAFPFLGKQYDFLQIDTNGHTDFTATQNILGSLYSLGGFPSISRPSVSPFGVDLDYRVGDDVYYSLFGINNISLIKNDIITALERSQEFDCDFSSQLQMALVVSHHRSRYYRYGSSESQVTLQVILAASATVAFAIFNYDYYEIEVQGTPAVGFTDGSNQTYIRLPDSVVNNINVTVGNTGIIGQWVFRIDQGSIEGHLGETLYLDCFIEMLDRTGGIQWHRNGSSLRESDTVLHVTSSRLIIRNFSHSDVGHYECSYNSTGVRGVYVSISGASRQESMLGLTSDNTIGTGVFLENLPASYHGVRQFSSSLVNASIELNTLTEELPVVVAFHQRLHWDTPYNLTSQGSWAIHNDTVLVHVGRECLNSAFMANVLFNINPTFIAKCAILSPDGGWEDQGVFTISTEDGVNCVSSQCGWHTVLYKYPLTVDPQVVVLTEPRTGLTVDCYANETYYHSSDVLWRLDGTDLSSLPSLQGHYRTCVREDLSLQKTAYTLTIDPGHVQSGMYSCEYRDYSFSAASSVVENTAERNYSLSLVAHPSAAVPTEGELYLNCTVRSSANTSTLLVVWKHNEFPIASTSDAYNMTSDGDTHLLTVVRAQTSLSGVYSCQLHHYNVEVALEALNVTVQPGCLSQLLFPHSAVGVHQEVPCSTIHPSLSGSTKWSCEQDLLVSGSLDCFFAENAHKSVAVVTYTLKGKKKNILRDQQSIQNGIDERIHAILGENVSSRIIEIRSAGYLSIEFSLSLELDTVSSGDFVRLAISTATGFFPGGYPATPSHIGAPIITPNEFCSCPSLHRNIQAALSTGEPQLFACRAPSYVKILCSCSPPNSYQVDSCSCSGVFTTVSTDELGLERCELDTDGDGIPDSIDPCIGCCTEDVSEGILWDRTAHGLDSRQPCSLLHPSFNQGTYATRKCSSKGRWLSVDVSGCSFKENAELSVVVIVVSVLASQADVKSNVSVFKTQLVAEFFSSYNVSGVSVSMYTAGKEEGVTVVTCSLELPGEQVDSLVGRYSQSSEGQRRKRNFQFEQPQVYGFTPANECLCQDPSVNSVSSGLTNVCKGASISPCQCDASESGCQCLTPYINVSTNGEELKCSLDTDGDKIPDHLDSYPFVFNSSSLEPQDGCQGGSAHCPAESTSSPPLDWYKVGSCVRAVLRCSTDINTVVGDAYRFCNSSGQWEDPDISQCQSAAVREAMFLLDTVVSSVAGATVVLGGGRLLLEDGETIDSLNSISESLVNISSSPEQQLLPGDLGATVNLLSNFATVSEQTNLLSVDAFNVVNLFNVTSNLLSEQNGKTWGSINNNSSSSVGNGLLDATERLSFSLAVNLNTSSPQVIQLDNLVVNVQLVAPGASSGEDIVLARPGGNSSSVAIPSSLIAGQQNGSGDAGEGTEVVVVFVDRLSDYLPRRLDNQSSLDSNVLLSDSIVSVQVGSFSGQLGANSTIDLSFKVEKNSNSTCVFWNYSSNNSSSGGWSTEGVNTSAGDNGSVLCMTSHLTNFAILVSPYKAEPPKLAAFLSWISYIGCGISFVCLLATIAFLLCLRKELFAKLNQFVHLNLCIALACGLFIFMVGSQTAKEVPELCKIVAFLLHYFFLASFFWMLCEAVVMFNLLVRVFFANKRKWILLYLPLGWGTPLPIAVISAAVRHEQYIIKTSSGDNLACWLSWDYGTIAAFIGPMCLVLLVNAVLVVIIMRSLFKFYRGFGAEYSIQNEDTKAKELVKKLMKAFLVILPLMGFTWLVGLLAVNSATVGFSIAFVVLNSLQGAAIFVLYVLRHDKVRPKLVALFTRAKRIRPALPFRKRSLATMPTTESMEHLAPGTPTTTRAAFSFGTTSKLATVSVSHSGTLVKETSLAANEEEMQEEVVVFANAQAQDEDLEPRRVSTYSFTLREDTVVSSASTHVEPSD